MKDRCQFQTGQRIEFKYNAITVPRAIICPNSADGKWCEEHHKAGELLVEKVLDRKRNQLKNELQESAADAANDEYYDYLDERYG